MNESLLNTIRNGGFIFYTRHGEATVGEDLPYFSFHDCLTQRNLSEYGRRQAIYYGEILRYLQIPIHCHISASPFCRTIQTAQLAFGLSGVQVNPFWFEIYRLSEYLPNSEREIILNHFNSLLEIVPLERKNKVIVAHSFPKGVGLGEIPYMGTVIIKPKRQGNGYEVVHRLSLEDWGKLDS
ncbi:MAG: histidine phosphatase family protein [Lysinibacillus sp.]